MKTRLEFKLCVPQITLMTADLWTLCRGILTLTFINPDGLLQSQATGELPVRLLSSALIRLFPSSSSCSGWVSPLWSSLISRAYSLKRLGRTETTEQGGSPRAKVREWQRKRVACLGEAVIIYGYFQIRHAPLQDWKVTPQCIWVGAKWQGWLSLFYHAHTCHRACTR